MSTFCCVQGLIPMAVTMRVAEETHKALKEMAGTRGIPMTELLKEVVKRARQEELVRQINEDYARLREDPVAWAEVLAERAEWDCTLLDGLEDDPWED